MQRPCAVQTDKFKVIEVKKELERREQEVRDLQTSAAEAATKTQELEKDLACYKNTYNDLKAKVTAGAGDVTSIDNVLHAAQDELRTARNIADCLQQQYTGMQ